MSRGRIRITKDQDEWDRHGWSSVPNQLLRDSSLSIGARWAFAWMASHRPDFYITAKDVAAAGAVGINKAEAFVKELEDAGYVSRFYTRDPRRGWITGVEYRLHPMPLPADQRTNGKRGPRGAEEAPKLEVVPDT